MLSHLNFCLTPPTIFCTAAAGMSLLDLDLKEGNFLSKQACLDSEIFLEDFLPQVIPCGRQLSWFCYGLSWKRTWPKTTLGNHKLWHFFNGNISLGCITWCQHSCFFRSKLILCFCLTCDRNITFYIKVIFLYGMSASIFYLLCWLLMDFSIMIAILIATPAIFLFSCLTTLSVWERQTSCYFLFLCCYFPIFFPTPLLPI